MKIIVLTCLLALSLPSLAQVNRCKGPGGKIIYSDAACDTPEAMERVNIRDNSIDASGDRRDAAKLRESRELESLMQNPPEECQFAGKEGKRAELAQRAKQECVKNAIAGRNGGQVSNSAQQAYRDNEEHRRRLMEAAAASGGRKTMTCTAMGPGMMSCK